MIREKRASIDIGSNSVILYIAEREAESEWRKIVDRVELTSLGREIGLRGRFHPESEKATISALTKFKQIIEEHGIKDFDKQVFAAATEASRKSDNSESFFDLAKKRTGINVVVISEEGEAYLSALGIDFCLQHISNKLQDQNCFSKSLIAMDLGGASTELIKFGSNPFLFESFYSLPVGSVVATEKLLENPQYIDQFLDDYKKEILPYEAHAVICISSTLLNLAQMFLGHKEFKEEQINGQVIDYTKFNTFVSKVGELSEVELLKKYPFLRKRVKTILGGSALANKILSRMKCKYVYFSTCGLRHGLMNMGAKLPEKFLYK